MPALCSRDAPAPPAPLLCANYVFCFSARRAPCVPLPRLLPRGCRTAASSEPRETARAQPWQA
eukprot:9052509-Pyramimonas_sp.AAC.1